MKFEEKYGDTTSTSDSPTPIAAAVLPLMPPDVEPLLADLDFATADELFHAYTLAWHTLAGDKYLANKLTAAQFPMSEIIRRRARSICSAPDAASKMRAKADGLWLRRFERLEVKKRRNAVFSGEKSEKEYRTAQNEIARIYRISEREMEQLRYFVCQCRREEADPALNRSLYLWSAEKMTGKTTVARIIAGVLNGLTTWHDIQCAQILSDIPTELQFERFARPKGTRYAAVVMDEAFTGGKSTAKYYGKFKAALTSDTCAVEIKNGDRFDVPCWRNYVFTSNDDISTIIADESERRLFAIRLAKPEQLDYERLVELWRDYIVNAPDEPDTAKWYRDTMPSVKGEVGVTIDDLVSAFTSAEFLAEVERYQRESDLDTVSNLQSGGATSVNRYQVSFPRFFSQFVGQTFDVRKNPNIVKEAVVRAFGEPKQSGNRRYFNLQHLKNTLANKLNAAATEPEPPTVLDYTDNEELPF